MNNCSTRAITNKVIFFKVNDGETGNAGTGPGPDFVGTTDSVDLVFRTDNTEQMRVLANGRVGIGTSYPKEMLHVMAPAHSGIAERMAVFSVSDVGSNEFVRIGNGISADATMKPLVQGRNDNTARPALMLLASVDQDCTLNNTIPVMTFAARHGNSSVAHRPLFRWENYNTSLMQMDAGGNLGIGTTSPTEILHINGIGRSTSTTWTTFSDERLKENINQIENARTVLNGLNPVTYDWIDNYSQNHPAPSFTNWGFVAQEVEQVLPDMVVTVAQENIGDTLNPLILDNLKLLNLSPLLPILVKGFQELDEEASSQRQTIDALQGTVDSLLNIVASCCQNIEPSFRYGDMDSDGIQESGASFILFQNDPNPFQYSTDIKYYIPIEVQDAEILVTDLDGRVVKRILIGNREIEGHITIYSSDLKSGVYTYCLLGDGRILETKKMVCTK